MGIVMTLLLVLLLAGLAMGFFVKKPTGLGRGLVIFSLVVQVVGFGLCGAFGMVGGGAMAVSTPNAREGLAKGLFFAMLGLIGLWMARTAWRRIKEISKNDNANSSDA